MDALAQRLTVQFSIVGAPQPCVAFVTKTLIAGSELFKEFFGLLRRRVRLHCACAKFPLEI
jgi:hypothetical protein